MKARSPFASIFRHCTLALACAILAQAMTGDADAKHHELKYEFVPNWAKFDWGKTIGTTNGCVVVDKAGDIYASFESNNRSICVFSPDGKFKRVLLTGWRGLHGLNIYEEDGKEYLYAAQGANNGVILKMDLEGKILLKIGKPKESGKYNGKERWRPTAIVKAPDGDLYIADGYGSQWIHRFDSKGKYKQTFGGPGKTDGKFNVAHGMALDTRGEKPLLLICDRQNGRLQHYDLEGNFVGVIAKGLRQPCDASIVGEYVAIAELGGRVTVLNGKHQPVARLGDNPNPKHRANYGLAPANWTGDTLSAPHGIGMDKELNVYVMDWNKFGRFNKFKFVGKK